MSNGTDITRSISYQYGNNGLLSRRNYPNVKSVTYAYDTYGNCTTINAQNGLILWTLTDYTGSSTTSTIRLNNSTPYVRTTRLDNAGNIQSRVMTRGSDTLQNDSYVFNAQTGNLISRTMTGGSAETFAYDNLDRLTQISSGNQSTMQMTYCQNGNICTKNNMGQYSYSTTSMPHAVNVICPIDGIPEYEQYIEYNPWNKAEDIYHEEGDDYYYYHIEYGPDQQRVRSSMYKNDVLQYKKLYWDGYEEYLYENGNSDITVWSYWIEAPDGLAGFFWNTIAEYYTVLHPYVAMTDHLGSLTGLYDPDGNKTLDATYDAWGKRTFAAGSMQLDRGFTGHEHLDALGLINMNGRMYDPLQGRFLSPDNYIQAPDNPQNYNRYSYCLNNPLKYTDPSGESVIAAIIIGALVSSAIDYGMQVVFNYASGYSGKDAWFNKVDFFDIAVSGVVGGLTAGYGTAAKAGTKIGKVGNWVVNHGNTIRNSEIVLTSAVDITGEGVQKVSGKQIVSRMAIGFATQAVTDAVVKHANSTNVDNSVRLEDQLDITQRQIDTEELIESFRLKETLERIDEGVKLPYNRDGHIFENRENLLPTHNSIDYYKEYVHPTPGVNGPGPQRIIKGGNGEIYFTPDHYHFFIKIR